MRCIKPLQKIIKPIKKLAGKSKTAIIIYNIYLNWMAKRKFRAGNYKLPRGAENPDETVSDSLNYINNAFEEYLKYSGISPEMIRNKRILEIGPGSNMGVALKFLAAGAKQVTCVDKFYSKSDPAKQYRIYKSLREQLDDVSRQRFDKAIELSDGIKINQNRLRYVYGVGLENAEKFFAPFSFDVIVSRAVIEHLYNTDAGFSSMDRILVPGGYMIHKIDLRDHGMFSSHGMHPLLFLTIPKFIYRLMTIDVGKPNRRLINYYKNKMSDLNYDAKIFITNIVGEQEEIDLCREKKELNLDCPKNISKLIDKIRPRLDEEFKHLSDEELMVSIIVLIATKTINKEKGLNNARNLR